jgi:S1-C subfamily serine protease
MGGYKPALMNQGEKWGKTIDFNLFTTVRNEALAKSINFKNFPMNLFGVKKPSLKSIAKTPEIPAANIQPDPTSVASTASPEKTISWLGATLCEPRGEALSAYGVAFDSGGVGIGKLQPNSPLAGAKGLQEGDLIRKLNDQPISSFADLKRVVGVIKNDRMNLEVIRSQSKVTVQLHLRGLKF